MKNYHIYCKQQNLILKGRKYNWAKLYCGSLYWKGRYDTVFDRMAALGLKFVGPQASAGGRQAEPWPEELPEGSLNVPTFHSNSQTPATASRQLDFVFASESIADRVTVKALNRVEEWGQSDHCRIMIEVG